MLASYSVFIIQECGDLWKTLTQLCYGGRKEQGDTDCPQTPTNATVGLTLMSYRWDLIKLLAKGMTLIGLFVFPDSFPNLPVSASCCGHVHFPKTILHQGMQAASQPGIHLHFTIPFPTPSMGVGSNTGSWSSKSSMTAPVHTFQLPAILCWLCPRLTNHSGMHR